MFKALRWEDWMGVLLGVWLLASPWVLGFQDNTAAAMNALVMGTVLVLDEMLALEANETIEEWIDVVAGLWLVVSPLALGFQAVVPAAIDTVAVGVLTILFAAWAISPMDRKVVTWWHDHVASH